MGFFNKIFKKDDDFSDLGDLGNLDSDPNMGNMNDFSSGAGMGPHAPGSEPSVPNPTPGMSNPTDPFGVPLGNDMPTNPNTGLPEANVSGSNQDHFGDMQSGMSDDMRSGMYGNNQDQMNSDLSDPFSTNVDNDSRLNTEEVMPSPATARLFPPRPGQPVQRPVAQAGQFSQAPPYNQNTGQNVQSNNQQNTQSNMQNYNMQSQQQSSFSPPMQENMSKDLEILNAKLDSIQSMLEAISQRLGVLEHSSQNSNQRNKYVW